MNAGVALNFLWIMLALLLFIAPAVAGIALIVISRRRGKGYPACGKCGYNVSGTLGQRDTRCPECGSELASVGVTPAQSTRSVPLLVSGIAVLVIPLLCIGGVFTAVLLPAFSKARTAAQQAAQQVAQAQAAQQQAIAAMLAEENLRLSAETLLMQPVDRRLLDECRRNYADMNIADISPHLDALWMQLQQSTPDDKANRDRLRAEMLVLFDRLLPDNAPAFMRTHVLSPPITAERAAAMSADELGEAMARLIEMRSGFHIHPALAARLQIEYDNVVVAMRDAHSVPSGSDQPPQR